MGPVPPPWGLLRKGGHARHPGRPRDPLWRAPAQTAHPGPGSRPAPCSHRGDSAWVPWASPRFTSSLVGPAVGQCALTLGSANKATVLSASQAYITGTHFPLAGLQNMPAFWFLLKGLTSSSCGMDGVPSGLWALGLGALMLACQEQQGECPLHPQRGEAWSRAEAGPSRKLKGAILACLSCGQCPPLSFYNSSSSLEVQHTGIFGCRQWCMEVKQCPGPRGK